MKSFSIIIGKKIKDFNKTILVDSDKSSSIRFFLLAANSFGISKGYNILESEDVKATINSLKSLGIKIIKKNSCYHVFGNGLGSFVIKKNLTLNFKNSGTLGRLMPSFLANYPKKIKLTGDSSLKKRDFLRVIEPLEKMGATFAPKNKYTLPLYITGSEMLRPINYIESVGSAQCKSLVMFAALSCYGKTIIKAKKSRDISELLLSKIGAEVKVSKGKNFDYIEIEGKKNFKSFNLNISGDISSAAFLIALTILNKKSKIKIKSVNLNPTRTGILRVLKKINAKFKIINKKKIDNELVGDIVAKSSPNLKPIKCNNALNSSLIDELPILFVIAAKSKGISYFKDLEALRGKETDRLYLMNKILNQIGIKTKIVKNSIKIWGNPKLNLNKTYNIKSYYDHRITMSATIMALIFGGSFRISDGHSIATSFPNFLKIIKFLGAKYEIK